MGSSVSQDQALGWPKPVTVCPCSSAKSTSSSHLLPQASEMGIHSWNLLGDKLPGVARETGDRETPMWPSCPSRRGSVKYGWFLPEAKSGAAGSWGLGSVFKLLVVVEHLTVGHLGPGSWVLDLGSLWGREVTANGLNTQASTPSQTGGGQSRSQPRES